MKRHWALLALLIPAVALGGAAQNPAQAVTRRTGADIITLLRCPGK